MRIGRLRFGTGRQRMPLNEAQRPHFRGVREALGTGYNRRDWAGVAIRPRELRTQLPESESLFVQFAPSESL
jgi:hypothetical protein